MTVTIVCHDVGPVSGMERQVGGLVDGLAGRGVRVRVVSRTCDVSMRDQIEHIAIPGPVRPFAVGFPWFAMAAARAVARRGDGLVHVVGCLGPIRADVVAIHYLHAAALRTDAARRLRDASLPYRLNQRIAAVQYLAAERWQLKRDHHRAVTAVSGGLADEVRLHYPQAAEPEVIPNGIDVDAFSPGPPDAAVRESLAADGRPRVAVFVGGGWEPKGLGQAIGALRHAPEWSLAVVGPDDPAPFRAQAAALGVDRRVRFAGVRRDMPAVYRSVDALVLPSAYETFSLVAHEAAATGCPIVATPVSGVTDFVSDGSTGFLVDRDPMSIAAALVRCGALTGSDRERLISDARAAVVERTADAMVTGYLALYERLGSSR